jgi:hypothetical protein
MSKSNASRRSHRRFPSGSEPSARPESVSALADPLTTDSESLSAEEIAALRSFFALLDEWDRGGEK